MKLPICRLSTYIRDDGIILISNKLAYKNPSRQQMWWLSSRIFEVTFLFEISMNRGVERMKIDKSLVSGSSAMLVLKLLEERDMYGYLITEELAARSQNVFEMKSGTLYPLLHTLEQKGFITAYEQTEGGRERRYYSITEKGRHQLAEKQEEWKSYSRAVELVMGGAFGV